MTNSAFWQCECWVCKDRRKRDGELEAYKATLVRREASAARAVHSVPGQPVPPPTTKEKTKMSREREIELVGKVSLDAHTHIKGAGTYSVYRSEDLVVEVVFEGHAVTVYHGYGDTSAAETYNETGGVKRFQINGDEVSEGLMWAVFGESGTDKIVACAAAVAEETL